jgi:hypothetical protein
LAGDFSRRSLLSARKVAALKSEQKKGKREILPLQLNRSHKELIIKLTKKERNAYRLLTLLFQQSRIAPVTVDANAVAGALISSGIGNEATNVVAAPATVPDKTIRAYLFSALLRVC